MGIKLCTKENCALERRNYPPGQHGKTRRPRKIMGYALQLGEKQKVRFVYGVLDTSAMPVSAGYLIGKNDVGPFGPRYRVIGGTGKWASPCLRGILTNL